MTKSQSSPDEFGATLVLAANPYIENLLVRSVQNDHYEVLSIPFWGYNLSPRGYCRNVTPTKRAKDSSSRK